VALRQLAKLGVTDIESRIRFERVVTPADWESKVDVYRGAIFNLAHTSTQTDRTRSARPPASKASAARQLGSAAPQPCPTRSSARTSAGSAKRSTT
jgi:phytoene dehydrogenase-like protein